MSTAVSLPFLVSDTNYTLAVPVDSQELFFDVRWNSRDSAWYLDIREDDDSVIALNVKLVLGAQIGRYTQHDFFNTHKILVVDTSGSDVDPGFDDLGTRVLVVIQNTTNL